jgi:hypothetical protein
MRRTGILRRTQGPASLPMTEDSLEERAPIRSVGMRATRQEVRCGKEGSRATSEHLLLRLRQEDCNGGECGNPLGGEADKPCHQSEPMDDQPRKRRAEGGADAHDRPDQSLSEVEASDVNVVSISAGALRSDPEHSPIVTRFPIIPKEATTTTPPPARHPATYCDNSSHRSAVNLSHPTVNHQPVAGRRPALYAANALDPDLGRLGAWVRPRTFRTGPILLTEFCADRRPKICVISALNELAVAVDCSMRLPRSLTRD